MTNNFAGDFIHYNQNNYFDPYYQNGRYLRPYNPYFQPGFYNPCPYYYAPICPYCGNIHAYPYYPNNPWNATTKITYSSNSNEQPNSNKLQSQKCPNSPK